MRQLGTGPSSSQPYCTVFLRLHPFSLSRVCSVFVFVPHSVSSVCFSLEEDHFLEEGKTNVKLVPHLDAARMDANQDALDSCENSAPCWITAHLKAHSWRLESDFTVFGL